MPETPPAPPPLAHGPATTQAAGQAVDEGRGRIFPCDGCGADLVFHIGQQCLKCGYCGYEKQIGIAEDAEILEQDLHAMLARAEELHEEHRGDESEQNEVRCESCGATVVFAGPLTSSECPYCASPIQRDKVHRAGRRIPVDGVLPFLVDKEKARRNLAAWVKSRWFAPNEFLKKGVEGKFSGSYLPFWTFDAMTATRYTGQRGEHYWETVGSGDNKRRVRRTRWYPASGDFQRFFDDVLVQASRGLNGDLMLSLEPWPLGRCVPFNQEMLAGFLARTYEIDLEPGFADGKARMEAAIEQEVRQRIGGDEQRIHSINTLFDALTFKHLLLPVWLLAYRYHDQLYQVLVNAATGEVQGERPWSWVKITLAALLGLIVALVVFAFSQR
jgi:hypothetical protein